MSWLSTASAATRLGLVCWEFDGTLHLSWNYPARLFTRATLDRLSAQLLTRLTSVAGSPPVDPAPPGVAGRILEQCRRSPDAVAVRSDGGTTSYAELAHRARRLAARLHREGVRPGDRVVLQIASFAARANAERALAMLEDAGIHDARLLDAIASGQKVWRLRVGPVPGEQVAELSATVAGLGFGRPNIVRD